MNVGQKVVVTGAAGGIGMALVHAFEGKGFKVIGLDHVVKPEGLVCWKYLELDLLKLVYSESSGNEMLSELKALIGEKGLYALINNAAVQVLGGVESLTIQGWRQTLDVNLLAPFKLVQGLLNELEHGDGCVVNISSIHARLTKTNFVAYATSKAALSGMTRAMAVDLGGRVRVNAIEPAAIATDMLKAGFAGKPEQYSKLEACHPQGRIGSPEEVAALALSIASGDLRFLHGACVGLDGGISGRLYDPA